MNSLVSELSRRQDLPDEGLLELLESVDTVLVQDLHGSAREVSCQVFGKGVYLRALVEWSNLCRNDCLYCGIRRSNRRIRRYKLSREEILSCCEMANALGLRTFVLQGGENPGDIPFLAGVVAEIRQAYPHCAITLSLGELSREDYALLRRAGADRYLLRHESANPDHYSRLHPEGMSLAHRLDCLQALRETGFQTGMGMMVGSPFQTTADLVRDIRLIQEFRPEMIGVGPFVPQQDTPLGNYPAGSANTVLRLYSILRLMLPNALIPSTTALSTLCSRTEGILAGANVLMPNFTPLAYRADYSLYDGKAAAGMEAEENLKQIEQELAAIGYRVNPVRGDYDNNTNESHV